MSHSVPRPRTVARVAATVLMILFSISHSDLRASEWKPFGLQGTVVRSLAQAGDLLCAGTESRGVWCRDPQGSATGWAAKGLPGVSVTWLWIDPLDPLRRFAAAGLATSGATVYRTLDGGASWTPLSLPGPSGQRAWAVQGVPGSMPIYAAGAGVWVSDDLGDLWYSTSAPGWDDCLEVEPTNPLAVWSGGETMIFSGFTIRSLDGGMTWDTVWDSRQIGDNQTSDVSAHPTRGGLLLTGHEGFVLRTEDDGRTFEQVLTAPSRFFLDWDGGNPDRAYAAGSPNGGTSHAFVSGDLGKTWLDMTGSVLASRTVFRVEADDRRLGVVYVATDDGVFRHYGGGQAVCLDASAGLDQIGFWKGNCPPIADAATSGSAVLGGAIAFDLAGVVERAASVDLGEAECLVAVAAVSLATLDLPDPAPGEVVGILARAAGAHDYGASSDGKPRLPSSGDCP